MGSSSMDSMTLPSASQVRSPWMKTPGVETGSLGMSFSAQGPRDLPVASTTGTPHDAARAMASSVRVVSSWSLFRRVPSTSVTMSWTSGAAASPDAGASTSAVVTSEAAASLAKTSVLLARRERMRGRGRARARAGGGAGLCPGLCAAVRVLLRAFKRPTRPAPPPAPAAHRAPRAAPEGAQGELPFFEKMSRAAPPGASVASCACAMLDPKVVRRACAIRSRSLDRARRTTARPECSRPKATLGFFPTNGFFGLPEG